jgi:hypothetical protein
MWSADILTWHVSDESDRSPRTDYHSYKTYSIAVKYGARKRECVARRNTNVPSNGHTIIGSIVHKRTSEGISSELSGGYFLFFVAPPSLLDSLLIYLFD